MAKNRSPQSGRVKPTGNPKNTKQKAKNRPNTKGQAPKKRSAAADPLAEAPSAGDAMWYLIGLLCTGAVIFAVLFASVIGGENYEGTKHTPTPPINQNQNIPTPNLDDVQNESNEVSSSPQPDNPAPASPTPVP